MDFLNGILLVLLVSQRPHFWVLFEPKMFRWRGIAGFEQSGCKRFLMNLCTHGIEISKRIWEAGSSVKKGGVKDHVPSCHA